MDLELKFMLIDQRVYCYRKGSKEFYEGNATRGNVSDLLVFDGD